MSPVGEAVESRRDILGMQVESVAEAVAKLQDAHEEAVRRADKLIEDLGSATEAWGDQGGLAAISAATELAWDIRKVIAGKVHQLPEGWRFARRT